MRTWQGFLRKPTYTNENSMRLLTVITLLLFTFLTSQAQNAELTDDSFDFWLGKWNASWVGADGKVEKGTNHLTHILDNKVIEEDFAIIEGPQAGFKGRSISVFNPATKIWHQAWADNQGGYFDFIGEIDGKNKIFTTKVVEKGNKNMVQRMVFSDIRHESFTWEWMGSQDGGENWNLLWKINYVRSN